MNNPINSTYIMNYKFASKNTSIDIYHILLLIPEITIIYGNANWIETCIAWSWVSSLVYVTNVNIISFIYYLLLEDNSII